MYLEWFHILVAGSFGLIIGSFLNVLIYRLHTGRSLNDRSHCLSCGKGLSWYELFPLFSYLAQLGRCRTCGSYIPYRYFLVEGLTAASFVLVYLKAASLTEMILLCIFMSTLIVGLVYDLYHMIIPDEVSYTGAFLAIVFILAQGLTSGWTIALISLASGLLVFLVFGSLWFFSKGKAFGFGDAKISFALAAFCGFPAAFSFVVLAFWLGAVVAVSLMIFQFMYLHITGRERSRARVRMKSEVPFAPFLIASFVLVYFFNADVLIFIEKIFFGWS